MSISIHRSDEHAPFDHWVITTPVQVITKKTGPRKKVTSVIGGSQFIVCAFCKHWINRPMPGKCDCLASCHAEARPE